MHSREAREAACRPAASAATAARSAGGRGALVAREELVDEAGVQVAGAQFRVLQNLAEEADVGADAAHVVFAQGADHALDGLLAVGAPDGQLGEQRVVLHGDGPAIVDAAIQANARAHAGASRRVSLPG